MSHLAITVRDRIFPEPWHPASWTYPYTRSGGHLIRYIAEDFAVPYFPLFIYADIVRTHDMRPGRPIQPWEETECMRIVKARGGDMRRIYYATVAALMRTGWEPARNFGYDLTVEGARASGYLE